MKVLLHYIIAISVVAVGISTAWRHELIYFNKVVEDCPKCVDLSGSVRGCEQELKVCFAVQDRLHDYMGTEKATLVRNLVGCGMRVAELDELVDLMKREISNYNQLLISCEETLDRCEAEFKKK